MKLLLINPRFPESFWSFKWAVDHFLPSKRTLNPPLGLATLAALSPRDWEIEIVDENIESVPLSTDADIVGICGMGVQFERQKELLAYYRRQGHYVVAGGSYASLCPEEFTELVDTVIAGEAEHIWPAFCGEFAAGLARPLYRETGTVSLADSPAPRFDLLDLDKYRAVSMQFSRGCPFRCEFCDIIVMFGRTPRTKPLDQVGAELDRLREHGVHSVFFVDDNLIGNRSKAKELLRYLIAYQKRHNYRFHFGTEASLNLSRDDELMELFHGAHFEWVFIGIESSDEDSLKETKKMQNTRQDILASVRSIYRHGIDVIAGFIVGFDNDTVDTFERQRAFITNSGIQSAMIGLLTALPKTPLYNRLAKENRLVAADALADNTRARTNVIPKQMTREQLIDGYRDLHNRLFSDRGIADRVRNKLRYMHRPGYGAEYSTAEIVRMFWRFFSCALVPGGWRRTALFLRTIPLTHPRTIPLAISDWVVGLSMRDYVDRNFAQEFQEDTCRVRRYVDSLKSAIQHHRHDGALGISIREFQNRAAAVAITMKGRIQPKSFVSVTKSAERLMRNTRTSLTLDITGLQQAQVAQIRVMLERLSRYGDRINVRLDEASRRLLAVDSSVFNLSLAVE